MPDTIRNRAALIGLAPDNTSGQITAQVFRDVIKSSKNLLDDPNFVFAPLKTANYTASSNEFIPVDTTSGNIVITLPSAPVDLDQVGIKHVIQGGTNTVTINCAGSDVINKSGGGTSLTLSTLNQAVILKYKSGIWYVVSDDLSLAILDARYQASNGNLTAIAALTPTGNDGKAIGVSGGAYAFISTSAVEAGVTVSLVAGSGNGTANSTALAAAKAAAGVNGRIVLPAGTYRLGSALTLDVAGQTWDAPTGCTLEAPTAVAEIVVVNANGVILKNITIDGRFSAKGFDTKSAYRFNTVSDCKLINCGLINPSGRIGDIYSCTRHEIRGGRYVGNQTAASAVITTGAGASTTTVLRLYPGTGQFFAAARTTAGGTLSCWYTPIAGSATPTAVSVTGVTAKVAKLTSDMTAQTTLSLMSGEAAQFTVGDVIQCGGYYATISAINTGTDTLTISALGALIPRGAWVTVDTATLSSALGSTPSGTVKLAVAGDSEYGWFYNGANISCFIGDRVYISGFAQAWGWWFGASRCVADNVIAYANFGYLSATAGGTGLSHATFRSINEDFPSGATNMAGACTVRNCTMIGTTSSCAEPCQGTSATAMIGNSLAFWGQEIGVSGSPAVSLTAQSSPTNFFTDHPLMADNVVSGTGGGGTSTAQVSGILVVGPVKGAIIRGNRFIGFNGLNYIACVDVNSTGGSAIGGTVTGNAFDIYAAAGVRMLGGTGWVIANNTAPGTGGYLVRFNGGGTDCQISGNTRADFGNMIQSDASASRVTITGNIGGVISIIGDNWEISRNTICQVSSTVTALIDVVGGSGNHRINDNIMRTTVNGAFGYWIALRLYGATATVEYLGNKHSKPGTVVIGPELYIVDPTNTSGSRVEGFANPSAAGSTPVTPAPRYAKSLGRRTVTSGTPLAVAHNMGVTPAGANILFTGYESSGTVLREVFGPPTFDSTNVTIATAAGVTAGTNYTVEVIVW